MHKRLVTLFFCLLAGIVTAGAQDVKTTLKQYEGKVLILRHPIRGDSQSYGADGKILKGGPKESWTSYGGVLLDHVAVTGDKLRFEGRRILFVFYGKDLATREFKKLKESRNSPPFSSKVKVTINLDQAIDSAEQANTMMGRVFALSNDDFLESLPDLWRSYMETNFLYDPSKQREGVVFWKREQRQGDKKPVQETAHNEAGSNGPQIYRVGSGVRAPKAKFTPEPEFSELARYERYQGVAVMSLIVGADGNVQNPKLLRPLGMGLDENALSSVRTWHFEPATRNGEPVAVEMNIEISFNLY